MLVHWNKEEPGFLPEWLWQYGPGPFEVVEIHSVPAKSNWLGVFEATRVEIKYDPGNWYTLALPESNFFNQLPINIPK